MSVSSFSAFERRSCQFLDYVIDEETRVTTYNIQMSASGAAWTIAKQFDEFFHLNQKLRKRFPSVAILDFFPSLRVMEGIDHQFVDRRRTVLEAYLTIIMLHPVLWYCDLVQEFVEADGVGGHIQGNLEKRMAKIIKVEYNSDKKDTAYEVRVFYGEAEWSVFLTYDELRRCADVLRSRFPNIRNIQYFPRSKWIGRNKDNFVERRRQCMEAWIQIAVSNPILWQSDVLSIALKTAKGLEDNEIGRRVVYIHGIQTVPAWRDYIIYNVVVEHRGEQYFINRRFAEFRAMALELKRLYGHNEELRFVNYFPDRGRLFNNLDPQFVGRRQELLDAYIRMIATDPSLWKSDAFQMFIMPDPEPLSDEEEYAVNGGKGLSNGLMGSRSPAANGYSALPSSVMTATRGSSFRTPLPPPPPPEPANGVIQPLYAEVETNMTIGCDATTLKRVITSLNEVLEEFPNHVPTLVNTGIARALLGRTQVLEDSLDAAANNFGLACELLEQALAADKTCIEAKLALGVCLYYHACSSNNSEDKVDLHKRAMSTLQAVREARPNIHQADVFFAYSALRLAGEVDAKAKERLVGLALTEFSTLARELPPEPTFLFRWRDIMTVCLHTVPAKEKELYEKMTAKKNTIMELVCEWFAKLATIDMANTDLILYEKWAEIYRLRSVLAESKQLRTKWADIAKELMAMNEFLAAPVRSFVHVGFLYKRGKKIKNWKRRWFMLCRDDASGEPVLLYFLEMPKKATSKPKGVVELGNLTECVQYDDDALEQKLDIMTGSCFKVTTSDRTFQLAANSPAERAGWVDAINRAVKGDDAADLLPAVPPDMSILSPDYILVDV